MIEFTKGDMFEEPADIRVNTVNCKGVMGAGVALAFKSHYPEMFKDYRRACDAGEVQPGHLHVWKTLTGEWVINFPTKRDWRDPSRYEDIASGLSALRTYLQSQGPVRVVLPALGCGHGGLDWNRVAPMIEQNLADLEARIRVFEPADSRAAGRKLKQAPTEEQTHVLVQLGFRTVDLGQALQVASQTAFLKGNADLMAKPWIALLASKDPCDREMKALDAVANEMGRGSTLPVALIYATKETEKIAHVFLDRNVPVILVIPFGPLTRKSVAEAASFQCHPQFALISVAAADTPWSKSNSSDAFAFVRAGASGALISDPAPAWLSATSLSSLSRNPLYYLRYNETAPEIRSKLERGGAKPIGRRSHTGAPNLAALVHPVEAIAFPNEITAPDSGAESFEGELSSLTPGRIQELAAEIEKLGFATGQVGFLIPDTPKTEPLRRLLRRYFGSSSSDKANLVEHTRKAGGGD